MTPFEFVVEGLEAGTSFSRLQARGTLHLALRGAGFDHTASSRELAVVLRKILPRELATRGVESAEALCENLAHAISERSFDATDNAATAADVFRRLGGG